MKSYYVYSEWCSWLLSVAEDEIMHQDITPLCAADIQDQLKKRFAYLSGGRGQDGSPVITFPDYPAFGDVPDKEFQNVMTYLTSIPSLQDAGIGFILVIDRRQDKWTSVKASILRIAGCYPVVFQQPRHLILPVPEPAAGTPLPAFSRRRAAAVAAALWLFLAAGTVREGRVKSAASALPTSSMWSASPTLALGSRGPERQSRGCWRGRLCCSQAVPKPLTPDGVKSS
uniref:Guanine nucleotide exchange factor DBS-like n=1 Tax=Ursus maritimus TaxID=29073 RepID=A0A452V7A7_URSMA